MLWDVFISHAREDKDLVARPLASSLEARGLRVWIDEQQLRVGDSLSQKINDGLALSRYGIVILSPSFFAKDYPQRELQALLSRQRSSGRYILPVLHTLTHAQVQDAAPLLGDLLATTTGDGIDAAADALFRAVCEQSMSASSTRTEPRYFTQFFFPWSLIDGALGAIDSLERRETWNHLVPDRNMEDDHVWMGSDNELTVTLLFQLYAPLVHIAKLRYSIERTLSMLQLCERFRFVVLDAALQGLSRDADIALSQPPITYSPRVPDWRKKRALNPQQFWWQGLTFEKFTTAARLFYRDPDFKAEPNLLHFRRSYRAAYNEQGSNVQQAVGLLANSLYGFTPQSRPVYWRMLMLWRCLYSQLLSFRSEGPDERVIEDALAGRSIERLHCALAAEAMYEPIGDTRRALAEYYNDYVLPSLRRQTTQ